MLTTHTQALHRGSFLVPLLSILSVSCTPPREAAPPWRRVCVAQARRLLGGVRVVELRGGGPAQTPARPP